ncbi:MAG TPA: DNA-processing protein DprA [Candidatus Limnocylindrales bacterium]|nr:DNA-processing protein DprA [Candidatus Limnocylindrales bacterium]
MPAGDGAMPPPTIDPAERDAWVVLASVDAVGPATFARLIDALGTAGAVLDAATDGAPGARQRLLSLTGAGDRPLLTGAAADAIAEAAVAGDRTLEAIRAAGVTPVTPVDPAYPGRLRRIEQPPPVLFARGDPSGLEDRPSVAVVGTRRPTEHGRAVTGRIVASLVALGAGGVSGLALGIDGAAHAAALRSGGRTIAVIGGGHDRLYPRGHALLAERIVAEGGAVLSEHPPWRSPLPWTFPRRNRVISGMADAVVVVEAGARSGALTTAAWALEQGRALFLLPGRIDSPEAAGCLAFLHEFPGEARIVADVTSLVEDLLALGVLAVDGRGRAGRRRGRGHAPSTGYLAELPAAERAIVEALSRGATSVDELVLATGLAPAAVLGTLTVLEVRGHVEATFGRYRLAGPINAVAGRPPRRPPGPVRSPAGQARIDGGAVA